MGTAMSEFLWFNVRVYLAAVCAAAIYDTFVIYTRDQGEPLHLPVVIGVALAGMAVVGLLELSRTALLALWRGIENFYHRKEPDHEA